MGRHYGRVAEAWLLLILARLLVRGVAFRRWSGTLGRPQCMAVMPSGAPPAMLALACAHALARAALRQPRARCLPRAMVLQWMLRRRGLGATVLFGVAPGPERGGLDDLHAWVEAGGLALTDPGDGSHHVILRLAGTH